MNPDAQAAVMNRHRAAKSRLQGELKDQLLTRTETLDEDHAAVGYARERSELLCQEAKVRSKVTRSSDYSGDIAVRYFSSRVTLSRNKEKVILAAALSIFITRDVITHCYSSRNKSVPYV